MHPHNQSENSKLCRIVIASLINFTKIGPSSEGQLNITQLYNVNIEITIYYVLGCRAQDQGLRTRYIFTYLPYYTPTYLTSWLTSQVANVAQLTNTL